MGIDELPSNLGLVQSVYLEWGDLLQSHHGGKMNLSGPMSVKSILSSPTLVTHSTFNGHSMRRPMRRKVHKLLPPLEHGGKTAPAIRAVEADLGIQFPPLDPHDIAGAEAQVFQDSTGRYTRRSSHSAPAPSVDLRGSTGNLALAQAASVAQAASIASSPVRSSRNQGRRRHRVALHDSDILATAAREAAGHHDVTGDSQTRNATCDQGLESDMLGSSSTTQGSSPDSLVSPRRVLPGDPLAVDSDDDDDEEEEDLEDLAFDTVEDAFQAFVELYQDNAALEEEEV